MGTSETLCMLRIGLGWPVLLFTYLPDDDDDDYGDGDRCSSKKTGSVRFEVLTEVITRIMIVRDMALCSLVDKYRLCGGSRKRLKWRQRVITNINDGSNIFLRNVDTYVPIPKASRPRGP